MKGDISETLKEKEFQDTVILGLRSHYPKAMELKKL